MVNCDFGYTGRYYDTKLDFLEQTVQADWSRPYGEHHKLDIGGKAIFRNAMSIPISVQNSKSSRSLMMISRHVFTILCLMQPYRGI